MKKTRTKKITAVLAIAMSLNLSSPLLAATLAVDAKIADHGNFTRFVLNFPKLTGYDVTADGENIKITIDAETKLSLPLMKTSLIEKIEQGISGGQTHITLNASAAFRLEDYRYQRKIIFDIYKDTSDAKPSIPPKAQEAVTDKPTAPKVEENHSVESKSPSEPKATAANANEVKPEMAKALPVIASAPVQDAVQTKPEDEKIVAATDLEDVKKKLAKYIQVSVSDKKETVADVETPPAENRLRQPSLSTAPQKPAEGMSEEEKKNAMYAENPTKIAISGLRPSKIAVFKRSDILWIISDDATKTSLPLIDGPLKSFIPAPKILKSAGAVAYAYTMPKEFHPMVKKHGLVWEISLYDNDYSSNKEAFINTVFDDKGNSTKVTIPLDGAGKIITFNDPVIGDTLYIAPSDKDEGFVRNDNANPDFKINPSIMGLIVKPYSDKLKVYSISNFVFISSDNGLNLFPRRFPVLVSSGNNEETVDINAINAERLFNFPEWQRGGAEQFHRNKMEIQDKLEKASTPDEQSGYLMELATLMFANGYGYEASGILDLIQTISPEITKNPDFVAIRGAIEALAGRYEKALEYFSHPLIQQNLEIKLWQGFAAAQTEQWKKAERSFPSNNILLLQYPSNISVPFTIYMAESNLRLGKTQAAQQLLETIKADDKTLNNHYLMAIEYLSGEIAHQKGDFKRAVEVWEKVSKDTDRLYHTKASLSLTLLKLQQKEISVPDAVNMVENLRFAWRGDSLEVEILHTLGNLKAKNMQPLEALEDLSQSIKISKRINHDLGYLVEDMQKIFYDLFVNGAYPSISTLEAISAYNKFNYLFPDGEAATAITLSFSEYLVKADLLEKSAATLQKLIDNNLTSQKFLPEAGAKLASVYLIDDKPAKALKALSSTELPEIANDKIMNEKRILLKAKAYSQLGNTVEAANILDQIKSEKTTMIKADIFWRVKQWENAAQTLQSLIKEDAAPGNEQNSQYILNAVIAWKLAGNETEVQNFRSKYEAAVQGSSYYNAFKVITREDGNAALSNRENIIKIAGEVDIFKSFLDSYKNSK